MIGASGRPDGGVGGRMLINVQYWNAGRRFAHSAGSQLGAAALGRKGRLELAEWSGVESSRAGGKRAT